MSQQKILNTLQNLGLSFLDAQVYLFLGKKGPKKVSELVQSLKIPKQQLYTILKNLQSKGIVNATLEHPARFSIEPFEKVLDLFVKAKMEEAQRIQGDKNEILADWQSIKIEEDKNNTATFKVLEGNNYIYPKLKQMTEEAKAQLLIVVTIPELIRINQNEVLDEIISSVSKSKIKLKILTEISSKNTKIANSLFQKTLGNLEVKIPDLGLKLPNSMVIRDEDEVAFIISSIENNGDDKHTTCLWTNCKALIQSFSSVFEDSWHNATEIRKKIAEIETGKPSPKTFVIKDADTAHKKYAEITRSAKSSIFILTSSTGIVEYWKNRNQAENWVQKGVSVRIMAPIMNENIEATRQLMKIFEVKHVPVGYVGTTIVDSQHLFQFKTPMTQKELQRSMSYFENTIYTDDSEYVKKTENMLNDIWKNASIPSTITLKSIVNASAPTVGTRFEMSRFSKYRKIIGWIEETEQVALTEKDVIDKIINAKKIPIKDPLKDMSIAYYSSGLSIIHPPAYLDLPDMIIIARHIDKQSSMGAEDMLAVHLWLETPAGYGYVRAATVGDNPAGVEYRKKLNAGTPAEQYCHLVKEDEIQARLHGNTLFVGWTVPIPLYPPPFVLPPACLLFEGYGELKTGVTKYQTPVGHTHVTEFNSYDAFVTFFHPASKYSGPGTDGFLRRDAVMTSYPPK
ncbi:MAG TPA: helix-turn-helix domain-containing protein [Candidatus Binatia bacterium]|nr:helix-turn-helix domain-containing protein [Candidatus Binatia bacterium]